MAILLFVAMDATTYTLDELATKTGIEARTIRNYIERGLLPSAQSRGRGASYVRGHLDRLRVIKTLRRAWPTLSLADIRIRLQQLTSENIRALAEGRIAAVPVAIGDEIVDEADVPSDDGLDEEEIEVARETERPVKLPNDQLAGAQRIVQALRRVTGSVAAVPTSKAEAWQRITVTEDVELSVRVEFGEAQLAAFRELADLLRDALTRGDAIANSPISDEPSAEADA